jgi:glycosyltransferase involved in cell wall biosynthesis
MTGAVAAVPEPTAGCPYISVLTVSDGHLELLRRKAEGLRAQALAPERFEWVVCLNGCDERARSELERLGLPFGLRVFETDARLPVGAARNACAERTCGSILLFSDDDCAPAPNRLAAHVALHESGLCVALETSGGARRRRWWRRLTRAGRLVSCTGWSVPGTVFRSLGGFEDGRDEREQVERALASRLVRAGLAFRPLQAGSWCVEGAGDGLREEAASMEDAR